MFGAAVWVCFALWFGLPVSTVLQPSFFDQSDHVVEKLAQVDLLWIDNSNVWLLDIVSCRLQTALQKY